MLSTAIGSNDGINARKYIKDNVYDLEQILVNCFLDMGVAQLENESAKITGKGKKVDEGEIVARQMQELVQKEADDLAAAKAAAIEAQEKEEQEKPTKGKK